MWGALCQLYVTLSDLCLTNSQWKISPLLIFWHGGVWMIRLQQHDGTNLHTLILNIHPHSYTPMLSWMLVERRAGFRLTWGRRKMVQVCCSFKRCLVLGTQPLVQCVEIQAKLLCCFCRYNLSSKSWLTLDPSVNTVTPRYGHSLALHEVSTVDGGWNPPSPTKLSFSNVNITSKEMTSK